ncbi:MAG: SDR family oxidoreductase [Actinomycetota bacterium]|nr:SDR family oxidoreductase [Actinomycetota bacterium]
MAEREVVVVTGASGGIGRAVAREFARHGAAVGLIARGQAGLDAAARDVEELGGTAYAHAADVAEHDQVQAAATAIEERLGPIDIWVNNAMTTVFAFFDDVEPGEYERATRVTYLGTVWGTRAALARMLPRDRGTIVLVGSALAYRGIPLQAPYCGAKHAVKGFFESLRCELRHRGSSVHVCMVQLPGLNTPQFDHCLSRMPRHPQPVKPVFQPEVAARSVYWAAHHRRRECYVGLPTVLTIVGNKLAPWVAERYLARTAIDGQQNDQPFDGAAKANLWEPTDSDHDEGAHGIFDSEGKRRSEQAWLSRHRRATGLAAVASAAGAGLLLSRRD